MVWPCGKVKAEPGSRGGRARPGEPHVTHLDHTGIGSRGGSLLAGEGGGWLSRGSIIEGGFDRAETNPGGRRCKDLGKDAKLGPESEQALAVNERGGHGFEKD